MSTFTIFAQDWMQPVSSTTACVIFCANLSVTMRLAAFLNIADFAPGDVFFQDRKTTAALSMASFL